MLVPDGAPLALMGRSAWILAWLAIGLVGVRGPPRETEVLPHGVEGTQRGADSGERACCCAPKCDQDPAQGEDTQKSNQIEQGS
jgi:hypothetical protein